MSLIYVNGKRTLKLESLDDHTLINIFTYFDQPTQYGKVIFVNKRFRTLINHPYISHNVKVFEHDKETGIKHHHYVDVVHDGKLYGNSYISNGKGYDLVTMLVRNKKHGLQIARNRINFKKRCVLNYNYHNELKIESEEGEEKKAEITKTIRKVFRNDELVSKSYVYSHTSHMKVIEKYKKDWDDAYLQIARNYNGDGVDDGHLMNVFFWFNKEGEMTNMTDELYEI